MQTSSDFSSSRDRGINARIFLTWGLVCVLLVLVLWGAVWMKINSDQQQLLDQAEREVGARAKAYAEQVSHSVTQIDQLSLTIKYQREHQASSLDLEDQFRHGVYQTAIYPVVIDANGYAISSTRNLTRGAYMGDLAFFKRHREQRLTELIMSPPASGRGGFAGKQIIRFSRRFEKPDGSFDGTVLIAVEPSYLASFHDESWLKPGDFIAVHLVDGPLMAAKEGAGGTQAPYAQTPVFTSDFGVRDEPAALFSDGQARIVSWKMVEGYPLVAVAALSRAQIFKPYMSTQRTYVGIASMVSLLLLGVALAAALNQRRNLARQRHEAQVQATFRLAVDGAREGFFMVRPTYHDDGEIDHLYIEDCNERAAELSGYTRDELIGRSCLTIYEGKRHDSVRQFFRRVQKEAFVEDEFQVPEGRRHAAGWFHRRGVLSGKDIAMTVRDISESRRQTQMLATLAKTDTLTGLPNRHWLNEALPGMLDRARQSGQRLVLLAVDLDDFKNINDALGHRTGDLVLGSVASAMRHALATQHQLARVGGDEFLCIIETPSESDGSVEAQALMDAIANSAAGTAWEKFQLGTSIGISLFPLDGDDPQSLMQAADIAMYEAKAQGKSQYRHYDDAYAQKLRDRIVLERELQTAIREDEFVMVYQPRVDTRTGAFSSMEALVRWQHPTRGLISPGEFITVAEQTRLVIPLGELIIGKVCRQIAEWRAAGLVPTCVSINVSALQLRDDSLRRLLAHCLEQHDLPSSSVAIELTESRMLDEGGTAVAELRKLRDMGVQLQIDDFGTGYSSLSQLQSLNIDVLKIDQSFVKKLGDDFQSEALCQAIVSIGRSLDILVVAEGVETPMQLKKLQDMGCDEVQGYLFSKPVTAHRIPDLMRQPFF